MPLQHQHQQPQPLQKQQPLQLLQQQQSLKLQQLQQQHTRALESVGLWFYSPLRLSKQLY